MIIYDESRRMSTRFMQILGRLGWAEWTVFAATIILGQALWMILPVALRRNESGDYTGFYEPVARHLAAGLGAVGADGELATRYPPGYPILLASVFRLSDTIGTSDSVAVRLFHLFCAALSAVVMFRVAKQIWRPQMAWVSAAAWVTYPAALWLTRQPSSELPFLVLFFGSVHLLLDGIRRRRRRHFCFFLAGAAAGFASLIRPLGVGLGLLLAFLIWIGMPRSAARLRLSLAFVLILGNAAAVLPWETFVWSRSGMWIPLSTGGSASLLDGWTYAANPGKLFVGRHVPEDVALLMRAVRARCDERGSSAGTASVIVRELLAHPAAAMKLLAMKAVRSWYATDSGRFETATALMQAVYAALVLLSSHAAWRRAGARRRVACGVGIVLAYFWIMTILVLSIARYMVPAIGLSFLLLPHLVPGRGMRYAGLRSARGSRPG